MRKHLRVVADRAAQAPFRAFWAFMRTILHLVLVLSKFVEVGVGVGDFVAVPLLFKRDS